MRRGKVLDLLQAEQAVGDDALARHVQSTVHHVALRERVEGEIAGGRGRR